MDDKIFINLEPGDFDDVAEGLGMSGNPINELTKALDKKVENDRAMPKRVRFCPSCGSRRMKAFALHYHCHHCQHEFLVADLNNINKVRLGSQTETMCTFETIVQLDIPKGRAGVDAMLKDTEINRPASRFGSLDFED